LIIAIIFCSFCLADEFDAYIIVSFVNATLVLSIGDTVEEVTDSGFLGTTPTLCCSALGDDALVQVYPDGIRHIRADKRVNEWKAPGKKTIVKCAVNQRQVVIALSGGELVYFEMDPVSKKKSSDFGIKIFIEIRTSELQLIWGLVI
jgi:splicing factor 3B subunit 3